MKTILIAIPTNKYIEPETFKSVYDLEVPQGYRTDFQFFYGYQIDQIRNLIAEWAKNYDYLFSVDSDIVLPKDTLFKMLNADKDIISGLYIQRKANQHILELYQDNPLGGVVNIPYQNIRHLGVIPIAGCGFGCVLIKSEVFRAMEYPHFVYKSAIDHRETISEDIYFCNKARKLGFTMWADVSIQCDHIGSTRYLVEDGLFPPIIKVEPKLDQVHKIDMLPDAHADYLHKMECKPNVVYDIGACVGHWTREAKRAWPESKIYMFDAADSVDKYLKQYAEEFQTGYNIGVLTDRDGKEITFYQDDENPGGNSYYKETTGAFTDAHARKLKGYTLDTIREYNNWPLPDLIKMDVQGAEVDILKGATETLKQVNDVILEAQNVNYNEGAPKVDEVIEFMDKIGFKLVSNFCQGGVDGDYHFKRYK